MPTDGPVPDLPDFPVFDGPPPDAAVPDAAPPDGPLPDTPMPDAALPDAALPDAALPDGPSPDMPRGCVAAEEVCNGVDDDCDEAVDEADPQLGADCDSGEPGPCALGQHLCHDGVLVCAPLAAPAEELCDDVDNDCDGTTDEGLPAERVGCDTNELGVCAAGHERCERGIFICERDTEPTDERCDEEDDDCDGRIDETFLELRAPCAVGVGACEAAGAMVCGGDGVSVVCGASASVPTDEVCDGADNDCDGEVDDLDAPPEEPEHCGACGRACEFPDAFGLCREGECFLGHCRAGFIDFDRDPENGCEQACRPTDPAVEVCDGLDNDCDGVVDDGVCLGDPFRFCVDRRGVTHDRSCDTFSPGGLAAEWWAPSLIAEGDDVPTGDRDYGAAAPFEIGGGHTRRLHRTGPAVRIGFHVSYHGARFAVGVFTGDALVEPEAEEDGGVPPGHGPAARGYVVWLEGEALDPSVVVRRSPDDLELLRAPIRALGDGERHWLEAKRTALGEWSLRIDGRTVAPEEAPLVDDTHGHFDRLSLFQDAFEGAATRVDDVAVMADRDGDDVFPPQDNCPFVANPDQADQDNDGRGSACDDRDADGLDELEDPCPVLADTEDCDFGGRRLLVGTGEVTSPWHVDPASGVRWRVAVAGEARFHLRASAEGRVAWARPDGSLLVDDGVLQAVANAAPDWLGERLLYHDQGFTQVFVGTPAAEGIGDEARIVEAAPGTLVRAVPAPDGAHIALLTVDGFDSTVRLLDDAGALVEAPILVPPGGPDELPVLARHPVEALYAFAATDGPAAGVGLVRAAGLEPVSNHPATAVTFDPAGRWLFAIEEIDGRRRLAAYPVQPVDGERPASVVVPWDRRLAPDALSWTPDDAVAPDDADRDGRHDESDPCDDVPHLGPIREVLHETDFDVNLPRLFHGEDTPILAWQKDFRSGARWSSRLRRLGAAGENLGTVEVVRDRFDIRTVGLAWRGGRYRVGFSNRYTYTRALRPGLTPLGGSLQIQNAGTHRHDVVAVDDGHVVLTQQSSQTNLHHIDDDDREIAEKFRLGDIAIEDFSAVWNGERLLVAGAVHRRPTEVRVVTKAGVVEASRPISAGTNGDSPRMSTRLHMIWAGTHAFVAWHRPPDRTIRVVRVDRNGITEAEEQIVSTGTRTGAEPRLVLADGRLYVVWRASAPGGTGIYFAALGEDGARLGPYVRLTPDDARATEPDIVWDGEQFTVAWLEQRNNRRDIHVRTGPFHCP